MGSEMCIRDRISEKEVTAADTLSVGMAKGGGQAVSFMLVLE